MKEKSSVGGVRGSLRKAISGIRSGALVPQRSGEVNCSRTEKRFGEGDTLVKESV